MFSLFFCCFSTKGVLMNPVSSTKNEFTWYNSHKNNKCKKEKGYFNESLYGHLCEPNVFIPFLIYKDYLSVPRGSWDRNVQSSQDVNFHCSCESSKAADLYQLSIWPVVYNTASRGTSDAASSAVGIVSFSSTSWIFSLLAKPLMLQ